MKLSECKEGRRVRVVKVLEGDIPINLCRNKVGTIQGCSGGRVNIALDVPIKPFDGCPPSGTIICLPGELEPLPKSKQPKSAKPPKRR